MIVHETERIALKVLDHSDEAAVEMIWSNAQVMKLSGGAIAKEKISKIIQWYKECHKTYGLSVYAVIEKSSGELIGTAGFNITDSVKKIEIIAHFRQTSWGKGYATEAIISCINMAKNHGKVKTIHASADTNNLASAKIMQKLDFKYQGKEWFEDTKQEELVFEYKFQ
ncbi:GNAT family N-acetyltransferase [Cytobacillus purgationiresistens]|uniref:RimJ/RimL family protein N-acetyltransferase n=1 Tax=Cytobacillus purgationiresistens TaxID=863449 RepID=A0ABU0AAW9_9BACI|nr:GNAT family N-acetyltransferase [Cytobacillus purgationiresistens]MDQ0268396.1 RimJ/RimL family protein N-acetyltransferase [Cytobacillus purgationiresistens]